MRRCSTASWAVMRIVPARRRGSVPPQGSCVPRLAGACTSGARPSCTSRMTTPSSTRCTSSGCSRRRSPPPAAPRKAKGPVRTPRTMAAGRAMQGRAWTPRVPTTRLTRAERTNPPPTEPTTAGMTPTDSVEGVLPVDKPAGPTSHDMVARARRALGTRRIGHTGTLDPFASGLMLLCVGRATRIAEYLTGMDKEYEAVVRLGITTDTYDATGTVTAEHAVNDITADDVERALASLR